MHTRSLGRSDITIAPIVFGGNVFGWTADEATSFALLDRFIERGFNAVDTADAYSSWADGNSGGESETTIGKWLAQRGRRDDVVIMSKVGIWEPRKGLSAANIEAAVEDSLRRLRTDYLDVYFAHADDESVPLHETLSAFARLVEAGKVRVLGASNYSPQRLREALQHSANNNLPRYEVIQPHYNLYDRQDFEGELQQTALDETLAVVGYFSLASGFLTGKYRSKDDLAGSSRGAFIGHYFDEKGMRILAALRQLSGELSASPAQIALAWLISRPGLTAPIVSATSVAQLDEILEAATLELPEEALKTLEEAGR